MTRARLVVTATMLLVAVLAGTLGAHAAAAQEAANQAAVPVTLQAITPVVRPGGQLDVRVSVPASVPVDGLEAAFRIGPALNSRDAFVQAAAGKGSSSAIDFTTEPLVAGPSASTAGISLRVVASGRNTVDQVVLSRAGVYPLTISLRNAEDSDEIASAVTFVVRAEASPPRNPLLFSWIWPVYVAPPPSLDRTATAREESAAADLVSGLAAVLSASQVPVSLWPVPATLDAARAAGADRLGTTASLEQLARAAGSRDVVGGPFALVSTDAWSAIPAAADAQFNAGKATLAETMPHVDIRESVAIAVGRQFGAADLDVLAARGADGIVVDPATVSDPGRKTTLTQRFRVRDVDAATFLRADPRLRDDLTDPGGPVAAAQRVLADLYMLHQDAPTETRGAVLLPDASWNPTTALLTELSTRVQAADFVTPVGLSTLFDRVPVARDGNGDLTLDTLSDGNDLSPGTAGQYAALDAARVHLDDLDAMLTPAPTPAPPLLAETTRTYLRAPDSGLVASGATTTYASAVDTAYASVVDGIDVPTDVSITLTSATARVPITLRNDNPFPVTVLIELAPESAVSTEGRTSEIVTLEASRSHTEEFPVQTAGAGTFRVVVRVHPPNGGEVLRETIVELTATGGRWVATALTVGSLLFLGLWWLWYVRGRNRRGKHTRGRVEHPAGSARRRPPATGRPDGAAAPVAKPARLQ